MSDDAYNIIWKALSQGKHVLLIVRDDGDASIYKGKVDDLIRWFSPIVKAHYGESDLLMKNESWLCIRKSVSHSIGSINSPNVQVMIL